MRRKNIAPIVLTVCLFTGLLSASRVNSQTNTPTAPVTMVSPDAPVPGGQTSMNGYTLKQFGNFQKDWHLVTVRYRKDTHEMRFVYANDAAWKTLNAGKIDYPDGAVFAKMGIMTQEDPAFASSVVPAGAVRYQFMVEDKKKHADMHGWGYALFGTSGKTFKVDPVNKEPVTIEACNTCHELVPERGYVFSQVMDVTNRQSSAPFTSDERISFSTEQVNNLPKQIREKLPQNFKEIRLVRGPLEKYLFAGTLDEIRPTLAMETKRSHMPVALIDKTGSRFSVLFIDPKDSTCDILDGKKSTLVKGFFTMHAVSQDNQPIPTTPVKYCDSNL